MTSLRQKAERAKTTTKFINEQAEMEKDTAEQDDITTWMDNRKAVFAHGDNQ
ncbi:hypothetical protein HYU19_03955 [Candidatus Woesearchaeota archaeon]|nr:hypothetical protein [Candidatus Woesearchaeota archaeon]